jgi:hypothetical protein
LQEALLRLEPRMTLATGRIYYAEDDPTIDWKKLAYFALSILWRAAADSWDRSAKVGAKPFIEVEATLQEDLRRFLLGQADYPEGVLLMLRVSAGLTPNAHMMSFPSIGTIEKPDGQRPQTSFILPGMIFTLVLGSDLAEEWVRQAA